MQGTDINWKSAACESETKIFKAAFAQKEDFTSCVINALEILAMNGSFVLKMQVKYSNCLNIKKRKTYWSP